MLNTLCAAAQSDSLSLPDSLYHPDSIQTIKLHEVKVVAHENRSIASSSFIQQEAIRHIQPFYLSDLMQLMPGGITAKVSFNAPAYFMIRNIGNNMTNALGTGINIDGIRLSTNADLQELPSDFYVPNGQSGIDTRNISIHNIESIEIIRGIPSVKYGDITSGMIIVNTRKNVHPYTLSSHITPDIKTVNLHKGWQAGNEGVLNIAAGYTHSHTNVYATTIYRRISGETGYNKRFRTNSGVFSIETGASGEITMGDNLDNIKLLSGEYIKHSAQALRFRFSGNWLPNYGILREISWRTSTNYTNSESKKNTFYSGIYNIGTDAITDTEQQGFFLPPQHWKQNRIASRPISTTTSLSATLQKTANKWKSSTQFGIEWTSEGNKGGGKSNTIHTPTLPTQDGYNFKEIPFLHHYAAYIEEKLALKRLQIEGGIRLTQVQVRGRSFRPVIEPRLNLSYLLKEHQHNKGLRLLKLRGGIGILRKMPTLSYLFGEPTYHNITNYRYRDEESGQSLAVVTTFVSRQGGPDRLELPRNFKAETGISGIIGNFSFDATLFYEKLENGLNMQSSVRPASYRNYTGTNDKGIIPEYKNGEIYINGKKAVYTNDTTFITSSFTTNSLHERKGGVEFTFCSDYIRPLATTFILNGSWLMLEKRNKSLTPNYNQQMTGNRSYTMCGIYDNDLTRKVLQKLSTTLRAVTEIPKIRLTTTIALQTVWMERAQERIIDKPGNRFYMKDAAGNHIEGDFYNDTEQIKYSDPAYYMDTHGEIHRFTPELAKDPVFSHMVKQDVRRFIASSYSPYFLLNIRVTKEIAQYLNISFYANNLAHINPRRYDGRTGQYNIMNPPSFWGIELQIQF